MGAPIAIDPTWVTILTKPTDGDSRSAAVMNVSYEGLAWRTDHLYANSLRSTASNPTNPGTFVFAGGLLLAGATQIQTTSPTQRTYPRVLTDAPSRNPLSWWAEAEEELTTPRPAYKQRYSPLSPSAPWLIWRMRVPSGSTLKSVKVGIWPSAGHGGNLPDEQPILRIWKCTTANQALMTSITSVQGNKPDATAYEQSHDLELTGLSYSLWGASDMLVVGVRGEEGNNSVAAALYSQGGLRVFHPRVEFSRGIIGEE